MRIDEVESMRDAICWTFDQTVLFGVGFGIAMLVGIPLLWTGISAPRALAIGISVLAGMIYEAVGILHTRELHTADRILGLGSWFLGSLLGIKFAAWF